VYALRLLGTASIEASQGAVVTGRAVQGRRLALLALLALARGRTLSRDRIVAVLWPEASPDRARPQLSDAVYGVRHALGDDVVRSAGDGLALNPKVVTSDVALFEEMVEQGRLEEAVALYQGPLLDGFHISGSVEFETWLDGERAQLDRQYARTLEALAEAAEAAGDVDGALRWWRRRAGHEPHNGRVALRLMRALDASGDRPGALQHARIHSTLLRDEFDADPDPEVIALADRLRREPTPASPAKPAAAPAHAPLPAPVKTAVTTVEPQSATPASPVARRRMTPVALTLTLALALTLVLTLAIAYARSRAGPPAPARSVGVLPFINMSPDPANTYFSDGLSEQIIAALSRIDGLRVAARTSSFALRNRELNVRAIADTLDVQAVLEGSVLVDGEQLRVIAQLIDGHTGYHIWSDQYDGSVRDAFALQDSVALAIADALQLRLGGSRSRLAGTPAVSLEAYDFYLRGLYLRHTLSADALAHAVEYFDRAIALEPHFAQAWAAKATAVAPQAYFRYANRDSVVAQLRTLTARALDLDPEMGEAHASLGILRLFYEWDWSGAHAALLRAIELNPNDAHAWHHLGNYHSSMGEMKEALAARERAVQLDPLNARTRVPLARDYLVAREYDRALEQARRAAQLDALNPLLLGRGPGLPSGAAEVLLRQGHEQEAVEEYVRIATLRGATRDELEAMRDAYASSGMTGFWKVWLAMDLRQSGSAPDPVRMAATHLVAGDTAQALDWLDRAFEERTPGLIYLHRDPVISRLRAHPRVVRIARAMKLPG
jgi:TolB-like protein/DNA-binding SARP family transcriptional activator